MNIVITKVVNGYIVSPPNAMDRSYCVGEPHVFESFQSLVKHLKAEFEPKVQKLKVNVKAGANK